MLPQESNSQQPSKPGSFLNNTGQNLAPGGDAIGFDYGEPIQSEEIEDSTRKQDPEFTE